MKQTSFFDRFAPWERRFSRKFRVELIFRMNEVLAERGFNQKDVAERAGWKESYVSRLLNGEQNMTLKSIARFEEAVGADVVSIPKPVVQ